MILYLRRLRQNCKKKTLLVTFFFRITEKTNVRIKDADPTSLSVFFSKFKKYIKNVNFLEDLGNLLLKKIGLNSLDEVKTQSVVESSAQELEEKKQNKLEKVLFDQKNQNGRINMINWRRNGQRNMLNWRRNMANWVQNGRRNMANWVQNGRRNMANWVNGGKQDARS